jgi:hypothetical protein
MFLFIHLSDRGIPNRLIACKDLIKVIYTLIFTFKQGLIYIMACPRPNGFIRAGDGFFGGDMILIKDQA